MPAGPIGEPPPCLLHEEDPGRVIPHVAALGEESIDLAADEFDQGERARRSDGRLCWETTTRVVIEGIENGFHHDRGAGDRQTNPVTKSRPRRLERATPS